MEPVLDVLKWSGIVAAVLAVAAMLLVSVLAWLLNRPIEDDAGESGAGRC